jgi:hypothetical protein
MHVLSVSEYLMREAVTMPIGAGFKALLAPEKQSVAITVGNRRDMPLRRRRPPLVRDSRC